jgi:asparagine synthase (glutamine-hydrolysing)
MIPFFFGGVWHDRPAERSVLERMASARPNSSACSISFDGGFGIGSRRAHARDDEQSRTSRKCDKTMVWVALAGEIHNLIELRRHLQSRGHALDSDTGEETVAALYLDCGEQFLEHLDGGFALIIWDRRSKTVLMAQDRTGGIRQLYYALLPGGLLFASRILPILSSGVLPRRVDPQSVVEFFATGTVLPPRTMFEGIAKLAPGHVAIYTKNGVVSKRIHSYSFQSTTGNCREPCVRLEELHRDAMQRRIDPEGRVGLCLSGGLDSSLNVAAAHELGHAPPRTFSISFPQTPEDESSWARQVARHFGCEHHELALDSHKALDAIPQMVWLQEEPHSDESSIPTYHLMRFAAASVDSLIGGDGPDHLCCRPYHLPTLRKFVRSFFGGQFCCATAATAMNCTLSWCEQGREARRLLEALAATAPAAYRDRYRIHRVWGMGASESARWVLSPALLERYAMSIPMMGQFDLAAEDEFHQFVELDLIADGAFGVISKTGKQAEGMGIALRAPFLDRNLVDFVNSLPADRKIAGSLLDLAFQNARTKILFREGPRSKRLPAAVLSKQKQGFNPPLSTWLAERLRTLGPDHLFSPALREANYLDQPAVERLVTARSGRRKRGSIGVYMLVVFAVWHRIFIESSALEPPAADFDSLLNRLG